MCPPSPLPDGERTNIVLTGFMGTGKTTVGRRLAERLDRTFVDTDDLIEQRHGPIPAIFETLGEPAFRAIEADVALDLASRHGLVIATGGGLLVHADNARRLGATGRIFCLVADADELHRRITQQAHDTEARPRPMLDDPDPAGRIAELLHARSAAYATFPQVRTSGRDIEAIVDDIIARL